MKNSLAGILIPAALAIAGAVLVVFWAFLGPVTDLQARVPGMDGAPAEVPNLAQQPQGGEAKLHPRGDKGSSVNARKASRPVPGEPVRGNGVASRIPGAWPWFRGPDLDIIGKEDIRLARTWPSDGPKRLWMVELGEGYAAAAVSGGRVYVLDHVHDDAIDLFRGLSPEHRPLLADTLAPLSPGELDRAEPVLRRVFPTVEAADYDLVKQSLREWLAADRERLLRALRENRLNDVDRSADMMRCLSLDDGREIWRNGYRVVVPKSHGYSRTVPAIVGKYVISFGPQCHVVCWDADAGKALWLIDLVLDFKAKVPEWCAGQCPLVDTKTDRLILAPSGRALLIAVDYRTGKVLWRSPNPWGWTMTHVSITPMEFAGRRMYVYCGKQGVVGVDAENGEVLWDTTDWQISMATCPSPVVIGDGRIFLTGGYGAGSMMLRLEKEGDRIVAKTMFTLPPKQFGCEQQTPVLWKGHLFGARQTDKKLVCIDLDGKEVWNSGREKFGDRGAAPYMVADGLIYAMSDKGMLIMAEATAAEYRPLARAQVIPAPADDAWGPMALVGGRLIVRDMTRMVCLDVGESKP